MLNVEQRKLLKGKGMGLEHTLAMLHPSRIKLDGAGGTGLLTPEMVAAALGRAPERRGVDLLVADLVGHSNYEAMERRLFDSLFVRSLERGWIPPEGRLLSDLVRTMLRMALYERLMPKQCRACKGRRIRHSRKLKKDLPCPQCDGRGSMELSARDRMRYLDLKRDVWERRWAERYRSVQAWLDGLAGTAEADVRRALR